MVLLIYQSEYVPFREITPTSFRYFKGSGPGPSMYLYTFAD